MLYAVLPSGSREVIAVSQDFFTSITGADPESQSLYYGGENAVPFDQQSMGDIFFGDGSLDDEGGTVTLTYHDGSTADVGVHYMNPWG